MIHLIEYGFTEGKKTQNYTEYIGHGFRVIIFDYSYKTFQGAEIHTQTFIVNTQKMSSRVYSLSELEQWLKDKKINKQQ